MEYGDKEYTRIVKKFYKYLHTSEFGDYIAQLSSVEREALTLYYWNEIDDPWIHHQVTLLDPIEELQKLTKKSTNRRHTGE